MVSIASFLICDGVVFDIWFDGFLDWRLVICWDGINLEVSDGFSFGFLVNGDGSFSSICNAGFFWRVDIYMGL